MGLPKPSASLLLREAARRPFSGAVATLGRQDILFDYSWLQRTAARMGVRLCPAEVTLHREPTLALRGFMSDDSFLKGLGFSEIVRVDYSDFEAPDYLLDLNAPQTPDDLRQRFDAVLDGGTLEHVFHLPHALRHVFEMLKPGGRVIHFSPSANHLDHGFYMFCPTLLWDYYTTNQFEINTFCLYRYRPSREQWEVYAYRPEALAPGVRWGGLDDAMYGIHVVATRTASSTGDRIPQQGWYLQRWQEAKAREPAGAGELLAEPPGTKARLLMDLTRPHPRLHRLACQLIVRWRAFINRRRQARHRGLGLKFLGRY